MAVIISAAVFYKSNYVDGNAVDIFNTLIEIFQTWLL